MTLLCYKFELYSILSFSVAKLKGSDLLISENTYTDTQGAFNLKCCTMCLQSVQLFILHHITAAQVEHTLFENDNELSLPLIKHDPTHTLVLFRPHRALCQVANSTCMCMLVVDGIIAPTLHTADGE